MSDHCRGIDLILSKGRPGEVYNIGGGVESENLSSVEALCAVADDAFAARQDLCSRFPGCPAARGGKSSSLIQFVKDRPGHDRRYAIDCGKIERELGYQAQVTLASRAAEHLRVVRGQRMVVASRHGRQLPALDRDALSVRAAGHVQAPIPLQTGSAPATISVSHEASRGGGGLENPADSRTRLERALLRLLAIKVGNALDAKSVRAAGRVAVRFDWPVAAGRPGARSDLVSFAVAARWISSRA